MSRWDQQKAQEAHDEASAMMETELTGGARLSSLEGAAEAFDAGVWYGIVATLDVLKRHGIIRLPKDGESRE